MDENPDLPRPFPAPTEGMEAEPPGCPGCEFPMVWNEMIGLWQCHTGGSHFLDERGYPVDLKDVPDLDCPLCDGWAARHTDGCPNAIPYLARYGECGEFIPVSEVADHMNDNHGADLDRDEVERHFVETKEMMRDFDPREFLSRFLGAVGDLGTVEIWAAVGYHQVIGRWPEEVGFSPIEALQQMLKEFVSTADSANRHLDELRALKSHYGLDENEPFTSGKDEA